jgi:Spy/CpxP family protein refolding chaperone
MKDHMASRMRIVTTVLFAATATVGCGSTAANSRPPGTAASTVGDDEAAGLMEHHRYHHGGVTLFIAMSLDTLGVSPEQREAVEKIQDRLRAAMEPAREAEQALLGILADGLVGARFDAPKVDATVAQVAKAAASAHDASADALNDLHATLTPPQRAALVDKVEAHWAVWQRENGTAEPANDTMERGHLATLKTELGLTTDQVDKIRATLADEMKGVPRIEPPEITTHLRAFGDAFRGETFDARALTTGSAANLHLVGWGAAHLAHVVETMSPVLTPDQRAILAQKLREHAAHDPSARGNT